MSHKGISKGILAIAALSVFAVGAWFFLHGDRKAAQVAAVPSHLSNNSNNSNNNESQDANVAHLTDSNGNTLARAPSSVAQTLDQSHTGALNIAPGAPQAQTESVTQPQGNAPQAAKVGPAQIAQSIPVEKKTGCTLITYQAQATAKKGPHRFTQNKFKVPQEASGQALCVRVDGTPVKYSFTSAKKDEVLIGTVQKQNSTLTMLYCQAQFACAENCTVPKDAFMDALAGEDGLNAEQEGNARWDAKGGSKEEAAADREIEALDDALNDGRKPGVFNSWNVQAQTPACEGKTVARISGRKTASVR